MKLPKRGKRKAAKKQAKVRADVPHRHDYRLAGTVYQPDGRWHKVWSCRSCPSRIRD